MEDVPLLQVEDVSLFHLQVFHHQDQVESVRLLPFLLSHHPDLVNNICLLKLDTEVVNSVNWTVYSLLFMYIVQCTVYTVHCTLSTVQITICKVHCTQYTVHYTQYTVHCILNTVPGSRHSDSVRPGHR